MRKAWGGCGQAAGWVSMLVLLTACGGGGGGGAGSETTPPPMQTISPSEALRVTAQSVMDVTVLAWDVSYDVQTTLVTAPYEAVRTSSCTQGRTVVTRPLPSLLRIEWQDCLLSGVAFGGQLEADGATVSADTTGTTWSGTVRFNGASTRSGAAASSRARTVTASVSASGFVESVYGLGTRGQPLTMQVNGLSASRTPDALGRGATLTSASLRVQRLPINVPLARDLYALEGCVVLSASGLSAELCIDAGSRIALVENIGTEQLTGRLRWNAGAASSFDARLRISPTGATALRVELDLDNNGSFETAAVLDRSSDIGLRL